VLDRRFIVVIALGAALAAAYRRGFLRNIEDPSGWLAFVSVWLPTSVVLGLAVAYLWPWAVRMWEGLRARRRGR
jgi:hypothetical protein